MAASATARPASGGRNVASVGSQVESTGFTPQVGVSDNRLWRYDEERTFDFQQGGYQQPKATPFVMRTSASYQADETEQTKDAANDPVFLTELMRGISIYESNMRLITQGEVRPGSVLNMRY